jgi:YggT family protein
MFNQASTFLLQTIEFVLVYPALLRFYMQLFRAPPRNPLVPVVMALTDFAVRRLRRFVPGLSGLDLSSLFWAWIVEILILLAFFALTGANVLMGGPQVLPVILFLALVKLFGMSLYLLIFATLVQAILSWVSAYHPLMPVFDSLTRPFLRPVQRVLPRLGNVDFSPLVVFVICQLILMVPVRLLENMAMRMIPLTV